MKELKKKEENDGFVLIDTWWNVNRCEISVPTSSFAF